MLLWLAAALAACVEPQHAANTSPSSSRPYTGPRDAADEAASSSSEANAQPRAQAATRGTSQETFTPALPLPRPHVREPRVLTTLSGNPADEVASIELRRSIRFVPGVQVRNQVGWVSDFALDRNGERYNEGGLSTGRVRWTPAFEFRKRVRLAGSLDLANGRWAPSGSEDPVLDDIIDRGSPPDRADLRIVDPRELYIDAQLPSTRVRIGQQAFTWGQGIYANDGNNIDRFGDLRFGDDGPGDIFERLLLESRPFATRPGKIQDVVVGIGGDLVFRDERVDLTRNDIVGQAFVMVRYEPQRNPSTWIGGYALYRNELLHDENDGSPNDNAMEVGVVSLAGQGVAWLRRDLQLMGAFETAFVAGRSSFARDAEGTHRVLAGGAAARGFVGNHKRWLVGADVGLASGDRNPNDRWLNGFTFDPGHNVGLILFKQVHGWQSARSERLARTVAPGTAIPAGTEVIATRGGVTNALYAHPKARYALWERLEVWGGPLFAVAPAPTTDPYATRLEGGRPSNALGGDGERRFYGTELDLGVRARFDIKQFWLQAGLQGGLLLPGRGLANAANNRDGPVGALWLRTEIRY